jgi:hypothetical protein
MRELRYRAIPISAKNKYSRPEIKRIYDRWYRPERHSRRHVYHMVDAFLDANKDLKFCYLVDMAFTALFARGDKRAEEIFQRDAEKHKIVFPWKD